MSAADASVLIWSLAWYSIGEWYVIIGVILEGAEMVARWTGRRSRHLVEPWLSASPAPSEEHAPRWMHLIGDCGFLILVIGLIIEHESHTRISDITDRENARLTIQLDKTTRRADESILKAGEANKRAALANERAVTNEVARAALEKQVEELRKENLALEARIQPRRITQEQRTKLLLAFKDAPTGRVFVGSEERDIEASVFRNQIVRLLSEASFLVHVPVRIATLASPPVGLRFSVRDTNDLPAHAQAILKAFGSFGVTPFALEPKPELPPDLLSIWVGIKPIE